MRSLQIKKIYIVSISTSLFWTGSNEYTVAANSIREARRIGILAGEDNNDFKRCEIRISDVQERETIYTL